MKTCFEVGDVFRMTDKWDVDLNSFDAKIKCLFGNAWLKATKVSVGGKCITEVEFLDAQFRGRYDGADCGSQWNGWNLFDFDEVKQGKIEFKSETEGPETFMVVRSLECGSAVVFRENEKNLFTLEKAKKIAEELCMSTSDNYHVFITEFKLEAKKNVKISFV
ncbi:hypothetical protein CPT_Melville_207 [Salmonella phage Melville]|uniref:Uncharacterized protein n=1 Tax=Salmonella phage Melville TaxID=2041413 RepID=A0A2D1GME1_9CAUD|nr:hypothetical protein FDI73_gp194 [Salmonella phage Melville]ATN93170.1 hypothetical protein CPT_Melville_207 [Salmonella phage Melville]